MENYIAEYMQNPLCVMGVVMVILFIIVYLFNAIESKRKELPSLDSIQDDYINSRKIKGKHQQQNYVLQTSEKLRELKRINESFSFNSDVTLEYEMDVVLKSAQQYARFDFKEHMKKEIKAEPEKYLKMVEPIIENRNQYNKYLQCVEKIKAIRTTYENMELDESLYIKMEEELFESNLLPKPVIDIAFFTYPLYRTGSGRETYHDMEVLWLKDIEYILKEIDDDTVSKLNREKERSLMSDSLRYDVLKRDNFRCTICGRTAADGIKLHVDHIMPIAKGGKTEMYNLRTLCNQCNSGKSDKWDEDGIN